MLVSSLGAGENIEDAILKFINERKDDFHLASPITAADCDRIKDIQYKVISFAEFEFDEFVTIMPMKKVYGLKKLAP